MKRTKVLHIGKFYPPYRGGMENHLQTLCGRLGDHVDIEVLVSNTSARTEQALVKGVSVTRVGRAATLASTSFCPSFASQIRASRAEILHLHWPNPAAVLAYLASRHRGKLIITYHSDVVKQRVLAKLFDPLLDSVLRRSKAIIATSPNYVHTSPVLQKYKALCQVIPLGIGREYFAPPSSGLLQEIRAKHGAQIILSAGRLVYYKGFECLIRAMADTPGKLLIVGEGPLRRELTRVRDRLGLEDRVTFLGNPGDEYLRACYHAAHIFALASIARSEAFGIVQVEAMAAGTPVVNTHIDSGVPFVSLHGETGLTVPPNDAAALSEALRLLLGNVALRSKYGIAARQRAEALFTEDKMAERTLAAYEFVLRDS